MSVPNHTIHLERFSNQCRIVISDAQCLADDMRHSKTTLLHLRASLVSFIETEQLLARTVSGFRPFVDNELVTKFRQMCEIDDHYTGLTLQTRLASLPKDAPEPRSAYLTADFIKLLKFAEETAKEKHVSLRIILHELFCTMRET